MTDQRLAERLRAVRPPTQEQRARRDLWRALVDRLDARPRWSLLDFGLFAAVAAALLVFPEWVWLLVYHL